MWAIEVKLSELAMNKRSGGGARHQSAGDHGIAKCITSDKVYSRKQFGETGIPSRSGQLREALLYYSTETEHVRLGDVPDLL